MSAVTFMTLVSITNTVIVFLPRFVKNKKLLSILNIVACVFLASILIMGSLGYFG